MIRRGLAKKCFIKKLQSKFFFLKLLLKCSKILGNFMYIFTKITNIKLDSIYYHFVDSSMVNLSDLYTLFLLFHDEFQNLGRETIMTIRAKVAAPHLTETLL